MAKGNMGCREPGHRLPCADVKLAAFPAVGEAARFLIRVAEDAGPV